MDLVFLHLALSFTDLKLLVYIRQLSLFECKLRFKFCAPISHFLIIRLKQIDSIVNLELALDLNLHLFVLLSQLLNILFVDFHFFFHLSELLHLFCQFFILNF